jgi:hypothetical protein
MFSMNLGEQCQRVYTSSREAIRVRPVSVPFAGMPDSPSSLRSDVRSGAAPERSLAIAVSTRMASRFTRLVGVSGWTALTASVRVMIRNPVCLRLEIPVKQSYRSSHGHQGFYRRCRVHSHHGGSLVRLINEWSTDLLDVSLIYGSYRGRRGARPHNPQPLPLKLLLYGYASGVFSSRRSKKPKEPPSAYRWRPARAATSRSACSAASGSKRGSGGVR